MPEVSVPRQVLEEELARYLESGSTSPDAAYEGARRHRILPLMSDLMGCWALDLRGRLVFFSWDEPSNPEPVADSAAEQVGINAALALGSDRYRGLASIRPKRPSDARTCTSCDGTSRVSGAPANVICACAGLGWLPAATRDDGV